MPGSAVIEVGGWGLRIRAEALRGEFSSAPAVLEVLLGHTRALIAQMAQTSICNHLHTVEQRFIRRLLLCLDLSDQQELPMTHETMARSLGMRRSSVTESALCLQGLGLIRYARGRIAVVDRLGLERRGCACYVHISESVEQVSPASQLATMATS